MTLGAFILPEIQDKPKKIPPNYTLVYWDISKEKKNYQE